MVEHDIYFKARKPDTQQKHDTTAYTDSHQETSGVRHQYIAKKYKDRHAPQYRDYDRAFVDGDRIQQALTEPGRLSGD